ncbi:acyl-CoA dehydrogenase family protein [Paraburkholderia sp. GAS334]|uniref:acyl-CoA dehydrogenase family protein n=1 Tax=Paraburkholderia sp. GAS334 TaxID=3035131 RepID=UPI003D2142A2
MNFELTDDQDMFVSAAKKLSQSRLTPILQRHPSDRPLPKEAMLEIYGALGDFGITAARLPAEHGGAGLSMIDYGLVIEQLPPVIALSLISHDGSITRLHAGASAELREAYLPDLIAGRKIACTANSEPEAGSDSNAIRTRLEVEGPDAYITGRKLWITNASVCDVMIVSCAVGLDAGDRPITSRVLVDRSQADVDISEIPLTGLKQGHLSEVVFDRTRVPSANIIGSPGDAGKYMTLAWNGNRPLLGMMAVGIAQRALDIAREYVGVRQQFGKHLGNHQLVQQDLADIETAVISSRLMCFFALGCLDQGTRANGTSAMAKRFATKNALRAVDLAMQLHGAMGIAEEVGLDQLWRDVRVLQVPDGTMGILALIQGRELTGAAAFR